MPGLSVMVNTSEDSGGDVNRSGDRNDELLKKGLFAKRLDPSRPLNPHN